MARTEHTVTATMVAVGVPEYKTIWINQCYFQVVYRTSLTFFFFRSCRVEHLSCTTRVTLKYMFYKPSVLFSYKTKWSKYPNALWHHTVTKAQLSTAGKVQPGLEIQSLLKCLFLTLFSKMYRPTKIDVLSALEVGIFLRNSWRFFFVLCRGPLKCLLMYLKWHQSWRHHIYQAISMNEPNTEHCSPMHRTTGKEVWLACEYARAPRWRPVNMCEAPFLPGG